MGSCVQLVLKGALFHFQVATRVVVLALPSMISLVAFPTFVGWVHGHRGALFHCWL
jgi:hypothetical protein